MIDLLIFDCDGVVVDSELLANELAAKLKTEAGYSISTEEHMRRFVGLSNKAPEYIELYRQLPENYNETAKIEIERVFKAELKAVDGIEDVLKILPIKYCLASSGTMDKMKLTLGITKLYKYFENKIFSAQMVERGKPAPDVFLLAAREMNTHPSKCIVIEDSAPGIIAAKAAGMKVFGFTGGSHMFDFMKTKVIDEKPDFIFDDMSELPALINWFDVR